MTGRPGDRTMETNGGSTASYLARTLLRPCVFACFDRSGSKGAFRLPGAKWDHCRCTVEPSPGHIRCRILSLALSDSSRVSSRKSTSSREIALFYQEVARSLPIRLLHVYSV